MSVNGLSIEQTTLVVVDVQGKLAQLMVDPPALYARIATVIQAARILEIPVLWCQQVPKALGPTVVEVAQHLEGLSPIDKSAFSCWLEPSFRDALAKQERSHVLLCGIETHVCIYQTARDLKQNGFMVEVLADAVSSRSATHRDLAFKRMAQEGITLSNVEMALFDLLKDAKHPKFRDIARLVK